jgi:hypothetical protein
VCETTATGETTHCERCVSGWQQPPRRCVQVRPCAGVLTVRSRISVSSSAVETDKASPPHRPTRGRDRPRCRHFKNQSCCRLGSERVQRGARLARADGTPTLAETGITHETGRGSAGMTALSQSVTLSVCEATRDLLLPALRTELARGGAGRNPVRRVQVRSRVSPPAPHSISYGHVGCLKARAFPPTV